MDAGAGSNGYDGTLYYYDLHGTLVDQVQIDDYTYLFSVGSLAFDGIDGEVQIEDRDGFRVCVVFTAGSFLTEGQQLYLYAPGAPVSALPPSYAPSAWIIEGAEDSATLLVYGLYSGEYDMWWFSSGTFAASTLTVTEDFVNVRSGPGKEYPSIGMVNSGTTLTITGTMDSWYQIEYNGATAYIIEDYVAVD